MKILELIFSDYADSDSGYEYIGIMIYGLRQKNNSFSQGITSNRAAQKGFILAASETKLLGNYELCMNISRLSAQ